LGYLKEFLRKKLKSAKKVTKLPPLTVLGGSHHFHSVPLVGSSEDSDSSCIIQVNRYHVPAVVQAAVVRIPVETCLSRDGLLKDENSGQVPL
jgi:hypothetical protein